MLTDQWRDVLTIAATLVTIVGFALTIWQVRSAKSAAMAAKDAADKAVEESRKSFQRYAISNIRRFFHEAIIYVEKEDWIMAAARLYDTAEQTAQMIHIDRAGDASWQEVTAKLRHWAELMKKIASAKSKLQPRRWADFRLAFSAKLDAYHGPFVPQEERVSHEPA